MKEEIKKFFKGEVEDDEETLSRYSRDASVFEVRPKLVLYPRDSEDVKSLVKWVSENKEKYPDLAITPRCAGTDMSGGAIGESIILDFTRHMNKLVGGPLPLENSTFSQKHAGLAGGGSYPSVPSYITVEPGMLYRDLEKITLAKGLILPCFTASKSVNAMGGMFGNNSAGEKTLKYGQTAAYVLSCKMVLSDGREYEIKPLSTEELVVKASQPDFEGGIYSQVRDLIEGNAEEIREAKPKVGKNSSGYALWDVYSDDSFDLNKLLVGSQGTLGIVTEITFKLIPIPKNVKLAVVFVNNLDSLGRLVYDILETGPEALESYDDKTTRLAVRFFPDFLKNKGFWGALESMWNFLPEIKMMLQNGFPRMILLVEFSGETEAEAIRKCLSLKKKMKIYKATVHVTQSETESEKYWNIRRESFALLRKHVRGMHTAPFIDDVIVEPKFLPKFLPELYAILEKYNLVYALSGHAGNGNFHIIPLMDFSRPETGKIIDELSARVFDLVLRYQGSIAAEHNDGLIRTPYLGKMYGGRVIEIFRQVKKIFDPLNIFNPGKKVPEKDFSSARQYLLSHIASDHKAEHKV